MSNTDGTNTTNTGHVGPTDDEELEAKAAAGDSMARRELFHRKVGSVAWLPGSTNPSDANGRLSGDPLYVEPKTEEAK